MNWDQAVGKWDQVKGEIRSRWAKLTDDDVKMMSAKKDMLVGKIQERYGILKDEAEKQVDDWIGKIGEHRAATPPKPGQPRH
jgi:uncharacterized protein YjbJ (UPF0337 family)